MVVDIPKYCVRTKGSFYPYTVEAKNKKEAKEKIKEWLGVKRLSAEVWKVDEELQDYFIKQNVKEGFSFQYS